MIANPTQVGRTLLDDIKNKLTGSKDKDEPKEPTLMDALKEQRAKDAAKNGPSLEEMMKKKTGN